MPKFERKNSFDIYDKRKGTHLPFSEAGLYYFGNNSHCGSAKFQSRLIRWGPTIISIISNIILLIIIPDYLITDSMQQQEINKAIQAFVGITGLTYALIISNIVNRSLTRKCDLEDAIGVEAMILKSIVTILSSIDHKDNDLIINIDSAENSDEDIISQFEAQHANALKPIELHLDSDLQSELSTFHPNTNPLQDCFNILTIYGCRSLYECMGYQQRQKHNFLVDHIRNHCEYNIHPLLMIKALSNTGIIGEGMADKVLMNSLVKSIKQLIGGREKRIRLLNNTLPLSLWGYILMLMICMFFGVTYLNTGSSLIDTILGIVVAITITGTLHIIADLQDCLNGGLVASNEPLKRFMTQISHLSNIGVKRFMRRSKRTADSFVILRRQRKKSSMLFSIGAGKNQQRRNPDLDAFGIGLPTLAEVNEADAKVAFEDDIATD